MLVVIATAQLMIVLDLTIVNVALPHIQAALHFSGSNLEWVANAYAVAFGGLLLLGGRSGDLLERRRVFIAGLLVFALASLLGGFATDQAWLIRPRRAGRRRGDGRAYRRLPHGESPDDAFRRYATALRSLLARTEPVTLIMLHESALRDSV